MQMLETIRNLPNVSSKDLIKKNELTGDYENFQNIIYAGMGGSGITGDIVKDLIFGEAKMPFVVSKGYSLPKFANENSLFICVSYSGGTQETISQLDEAMKSRCKVYIITSGGYLEKFASEKNIPYTKLPKGFVPRMSVPYIFQAVTDLLFQLGIIKNHLSFGNLRKYEKEIEVSASSIARRAHGKNLVIYSEYFSVCHRFKSELNENAKMIVRYDILPELVHNEIETWKHLDGNHCILLFVDDVESSPMKKVIQTVKEMIDGKSELIEIRAKGANKFERIMSMIWIGDFISYYLAELEKVDYSKTPSIAFYKSLIG